jgi:hypothetical protein
MADIALSTHWHATPVGFLETSVSAPKQSVSSELVVCPDCYCVICGLKKAIGLRWGISASCDVARTVAWRLSVGHPRSNTAYLISRCLEICYQYRSGWDGPVSFNQFIATCDQSTYFCINYPSGARDRLKACIEKDASVAHRAFFLDTLAADDSLKQWQVAIGQRRAKLRRYV